MYHAITDLADDPNMLSTSPERFEAQLRHLERRNLRGVSVQELRLAMSPAASPAGLIGLTFDDGYADFLHTAVPILEKFGFSATVFAVAGMLGKENDWEHVYNPRPPMRLLGSEELREVSERGMEVGSHSMTHTALPGLDRELLEQELGDSRRKLGEILGEAVEGFCYPYGGLDAAAVAAARRTGYGYACSFETRVERSAYDLPRIAVSQKDNYLRFVAKLKVYSQYRRAARLLR
jgi:peptidoglycan/xylan/chitin deacetylase (PgdA/CDA1 family)